MRNKRFDKLETRGDKSRKHLPTLAQLMKFRRRLETKDAQVPEQNPAPAVTLESPRERPLPSTAPTDLQRAKRLAESERAIRKMHAADRVNEAWSKVMMGAGLLFLIGLIGITAFQNQNAGSAVRMVTRIIITIMFGF